MLTIHLHTGLEKPLEQFIKDMKFSGYTLSTNPKAIPRSQTNTRYLQFRRPTHSTAGSSWVPS